MRSLQVAMMVAASFCALAGSAHAAPESAIDGYVATAPGTPGASPAPAVFPFPVTQPVLSWRVENPFRFFNDPADTEVHRATYNALTPQERAKPVLASERALSARHEEGWAATMYRKTCWNWVESRFVCPDDDYYINPKTHTVIAELKGLPEAQSASTVECEWSATANGQTKKTAKTITQSCTEPVKFDVPYPQGAQISVEIGGAEVARSDVRVRDLLIAGMGDSFGSGEGNPDIPVRFSRERSADYGKSTDEDMTGFPVRIGPWKQIGDKDFIDENARWLDQACHRSLYSYQLRAALQLAVEDPHRAVTFVGVACSGSEVVPGLFLRYKGNEWGTPSAGNSRRSRRWPRRSAATKTRPCKTCPKAYHMNGKNPRFAGRPCAAQMRTRQRPQDRPALRLHRR